MEWFGGDISDAVRISKEKNVIFVVFIAGKTDDSNAFDELLNNSTIASKLNDTSRYLAVKIESDTDTYKQFAQIYRLVPVPSVFFIGQFGQPIEIVAGNVTTVEAFQERMTVAEGIFYKTTTSETPAGSSSNTSSSTVAAPKSSVQNEKKAPEKPKPQKTEEPQSKEDLEMQQLKETRRREKAADDEARRRVLEQIKMDRLRRQPNLQQEVVQSARPITESVPLANLPDMARIQFRKPTGETIVDTFKSDSLFGDVWKYAKASVGIKDFVLATSIPPRRELSAEHSDKTLIELNLAPSAVLLVIPLTTPSLIGGGSTSGRGTVATISNFIVTIFWTVMAPLMALWNRFRGGGAPNGSNNSSSSRRAEDSSEDVTGAASNIGSEISRKRNLARFNLGPNGPAASGSTEDQSANELPLPKKKTNSNIHRLGDYNDDDDNNTYNGNSTQQM